MSKIENPAVARIFDNYPEPIRKKMMRLRQLVLDTASETEGVDMLEETLKWGEPSYLAKGGSTIRVDWKDREPDQYAMYSSGPHHQDSGEAKIRESTAGVSRKPSSDCKACGCSSKHLCGLTAWNT